MKGVDESHMEYAERLRKKITFPIEFKSFAIVLLLCLTIVLLYYLLA